jgi:putative salt-induced outer membrane protein YdiY
MLLALIIFNIAQVSAHNCYVDQNTTWDGELRLGGLFNTGNTDNKQLDATIDLTYKHAPWTFKNRTSAEWTKTDDVTRARKVNLELDGEHQINKSSYLFGNYRGT